MANPEHVEILKQGVEVWNKWREENPGLTPDLNAADLSNANLSNANLSNANLSDANLSSAVLISADFSGTFLNVADLSDANLGGAVLIGAVLNSADLSGANLSGAELETAFLKNASLKKATFFKTNLSSADLSGTFLQTADLRTANLYRVNFTNADLSAANLTRANIEGATFVNTDLTDATLSECNVFGVSVWNVILGDISEQKNLRVTPDNEPAVYVDNLEVAQFVYLLLNNEKIRSVIDTIGEKGVLILGRFTPERKAVLDAIRDKLRELGFVPMMFDFEKPTQRDFTETIKTLAGMSRFIIADITNPKSAPLELQAILPHYMIPMVPILQKGEEPFAMFRDLDQKYRQWVLPLLKYDTAEKLIMGMEKAIIKPAKLLASKLQVIKAQEREARDIDDYL